MVLNIRGPKADVIIIEFQLSALFIPPSFQFIIKIFSITCSTESYLLHTLLIIIIIIADAVNENKQGHRLLPGLYHKLHIIIILQQFF